MLNENENRPNDGTDTAVRGEVIERDGTPVRSGRPAAPRRRMRGAGVGILENVGRDVSAIPAKDGAEALLNAAGLRWEIEKREVFTKTPGGDLVRDDRAVALTRSDTGDVFGYASPGYRPAQNAELAALYAGLLGELGLQWHRAGAVAGGRTIFVLARIATVPVVKGDDSELWLLLQNGHDTTGALRAGVTFNRLYCSNQMPALERDGNAARFRHNSVGIRDLGMIANRIRAAIGAGKDDVEAFRLLASRPCKTIEPLLDAVYPLSGTGESGIAKTNASRLRTREAVAELFDGRGKGIDVPGVRGTLWAAFNAITEYEDHHAPRRSDESALFGASGQRKAHALKAALALAGKSSS